MKKDKEIVMCKVRDQFSIHVNVLHDRGIIFCHNLVV
jgi:hypothetical protein